MAFSNMKLVDNNILLNASSGKSHILNKTAIKFWQIAKESEGDEVAIKKIANYFKISREIARKDYISFLGKITQGQKCVGSTLPGANHAVFEPTSSCNGGCSHCYHSSHGQRLSDKDIEQSIRWFKKNGIKSISLTGGEVLSKHFVEKFFLLVKQLKKENILVSSVSTNATFIDENIRDRIFSDIDSRTVFRISLDALRGEVLDRIRPGYRNLSDPYMPLRDLDQAGFNLVFTSNIYEQPVKEFIEIGEYLRDFSNVVTWNIRPAVPVHTESSNRPRQKNVRVLKIATSTTMPIDVYKEILNNHASNPFPFEVKLGNYISTVHLDNPSALQPKIQSHPCREDKNLVTVKSTGQITQCPILPELDKSLITGNIRDVDENSNRKLKSIYPLEGLKIKNMECASCDLLNICGGGCRLYSLAYDKGLNGCDLPAYKLLSWIKSDNDGFFRNHWPKYHNRFREILNDDNIVTS